MFVEKKDLCQAFEYGNGDFPEWFNVLIRAGVIKVSDRIFPELENNGRTYAGIINGEDFYFGDIFVRRNNGMIERYTPDEFIENFIYIPED